MLETIRQIGVFMIAAQAVVHFAPGRQYEKYIKSVSGIMILLLFLKPVLQSAGAEWEEPRALLEKWEASADLPDFSVKMQTGGVTEEVAARMETALMGRLNRELTGEAYFVSRVSLRLVQDPGAEAEAGRRIEIGEIVIGQTPETDAGEPFSSYRSRFAVLLEMEEERVEVRPDGRG